MISDVYLITNEPGKIASSQSSAAQEKVYLHGLNQLFTYDDLDILIVGRLGKQRDENKFSYLYQAYERISSHLGAKRKNKAQQVADMKTITARYFVTCLTSPDTFDLTNEVSTYHDLKELGEHMQPNPENLGSGKDYSFSKMQNYCEGKFEVENLNFIEPYEMVLLEMAYPKIAEIDDQLIGSINSVMCKAQCPCSPKGLLNLDKFDQDL